MLLQLESAKPHYFILCLSVIVFLDTVPSVTILPLEIHTFYWAIYA